MSHTRRKTRTQDHHAAAYREAGHALAAWDHRVMLMPVSIFPNGPEVGKNVWDDPLRNVDFAWVRTVESSRLVERLAAILMAGPLAQRFFLPGAPRGPAYNERLRQARTLLGALPHVSENKKQRFDRVRRNLEKFFGREDVKKAVAVFARRLLDRGTIDGDEATSLVEEQFARR
ncbi:MAG: hypothetical protein JSW58_15180 [Candidatus Latescibacterota bacterium]|nr:MAG: hypothetical protein JSW58_15180 [Candidatus Latescibacterota bacterium]